MALPISIWIKFDGTQDVRLPLLLELIDPDENTLFEAYTLDPEGGFYAQIRFDLTPFVFNLTIGDGEIQNQYSLTFNDTTRVFTTNCPFIDGIYELATTEIFTTTGTWTPSASVDTTKPVIVEAWGSGANGVSGAGGGVEEDTQGGHFGTCDSWCCLYLYGSHRK